MAASGSVPAVGDGVAGGVARGVYGVVGDHGGKDQYGRDRAEGQEQEQAGELVHDLRV